MSDARYATLGEALVDRSKGRGGITIFDLEDRQEQLSYHDLYVRALQVLYVLQCQGLAAGDELLICVPDTRKLIAVMWACLLGGITSIPMAVGSNPEHRRKIIMVLATLRRPTLLTTEPQAARLGLCASEHGMKPLLESTPMIFVEHLTYGEGRGVPHCSGPADIALVQFSSGSTADPQGAVLTHRHILSNIYGIGDSVAASAGDSTLSWMPLTHDMGLFGFHVLPLVYGMQQALMPPESFVRRPLGWLEKASAQRATALGCPNFGIQHFLRYVQPKDCATLDLSSIRLVFNGAEPISPSACREFVRRLAGQGLNPDSIFPVYGLAEATLAVACPTAGAPLSILHAERDSLRSGVPVRLREAPGESTCPLVSVGHAVPGCEIRVVDEDNRVLPQGVTGNIQVRGSNVIDHCFARNGGWTAARGTDGWLETGDSGLLLESGGLHVVGRCKDVMILNGQNYFSHDLERLCASALPMETEKIVCVSVADPDSAAEKVIVFIQHRGSIDAFRPIARHLQRSIWNVAGIDLATVLPVVKIPRTTSGKAQRYLIREQYKSGKFDAIIRALDPVKMVSSEECRARGVSQIEGMLKEICEAVLTDRSISVHDNLIDCGASSLSLMTVLLAIDERYPGVMDIEYFLRYPSIAMLAGFLASKVSGADRSPSPGRRPAGVMLSIDPRATANLQGLT